MTLSVFVRLLSANLTAAALLLPAAAPAQDWPTRPITLFMGFPAGSGLDVVARRLQEPLSKQLGQPVIIDNKPGAAGNVASQHVAGAKADGSTLLFGTAATFAPKGTDARIVDKLIVAVKAVLDQPDVRGHFEAQGNAVRIESPEQFRKTVHDNRLKWAEVARSANITLD